MNRDPNVTQSRHVGAMYCFSGREVGDDVISGDYRGHVVLNFEVVISNSFRDIKNKSFRDGGGSGRGGHR